MWNLPAPGIEPVLPAGEVLSTKPPGKSAFFLVLKYITKNKVYGGDTIVSQDLGVYVFKHFFLI